MIFSDTNLRLAYNEYRTQYGKSKKYAISQGVAVRPNTETVQYPIPYSEFKVEYITKATEMPKTSWRRVAQAMAKDDVYPITSRRAMALAEAHERRYGESGIDIIRQYRLGFAPKVKVKLKDGEITVDIFEEITERREQLFKEGYSAKKVKEKVAEEYFGKFYE